MGMQETFARLRNDLHRLDDAVRALQVSIGDRPRTGEALLVYQLEREGLELLGAIQEARSSAEKVGSELRSVSELEAARRSLVVCQARLMTVGRSYAQMVSFDRIQALLRIGKDGGEWAAWVGATRQATEQCGLPLQDAGQSLAACWDELTELLVWAARGARGEES